MSQRIRKIIRLLTTYQPKDLLTFGNDDFENDVVMADHLSDNDKADPTNDKGLKKLKKVFFKRLHWKSNVRKVKRNAGQEYLSRNNKVVSG